MKMYFFDDPRTLEIYEIIKVFRTENRVGISVYPSDDKNGGYLYSLIGFDTPKQKLRYTWLRRTDELPLEHIHSLNDALIAMSNAKLHDKCLDFEITILFDDKTGEFSSIEFFRDVPDSADTSKKSALQYASDKRTRSILNMVRHLEGVENCGIMVFPADPEESSYVYSVFDYYAAENGGMKCVVRPDMKNLFATDIETFDDIVLAMSNAKAFDTCTRFEMRFGTDKRFGMPSMMFYKV